MTSEEIREKIDRLALAQPYQDLSEAASDLAGKAGALRDLASTKAEWAIDNDLSDRPEMEKLEASLADTFPGAVDRTIVALRRIRESQEKLP